jgi:fructokinase
MADDSNETRSPIVVALGEALFDCFPDRSILGGAPVNFIVHLRQLLSTEGKCMMVSRVGNDELGRELLKQVADRAVSVDFVQIDDERPTGQVRVSFSPTGEPQYEIAENAAWDNIAPDASLEQLARSCSAVCFGTLAQRSAGSRAAIHEFLTNAPQAIRLLDVNLRQHYITPEILESSLVASNAVKLNEEELVRAAELLPRRLAGAKLIDERAMALINEFNLRVLALTRGANGTVLFVKDRRIDAEPSSFPPASNADSVGAGDACSAGLVYGLLRRWPLDRTLELANRMGAFVASQPGGTPLLHPSLLEFASSASTPASG